MLCTIHQAHSDFIAALATQKPTRIITARGADETDIAMRERHIRAVTGAYLKYLQVVVADMNEHLVAGQKISCGQFVAAFIDVASDHLYAPLRAAANATEAEREWVA